MSSHHVRIECSCGGTEFRGRIEPTFRLRYIATELTICAAPWAPTPVDVYCVSCGAAEWNIDTCSDEATVALALAFGEMTAAVEKSHRNVSALNGDLRGDS